MPLNFTKINEELTSRVDDFQNYRQQLRDEIESLRTVQRNVLNLDYNDIAKIINDLKDHDENNNDQPPFIGAIPTQEYVDEGLILDFDPPFTLKKDSLKNMVNWAADFIKNKVTVASDGSQIYSSTDINIPVGVIQVVTYENAHKPIDNHAVINQETKVLAPNDLLFQRQGTNQFIINQTPVDTARFCLEMSMLEEKMDDLKNRQKSHDDCYLMYDGSLIFSFMRNFDEQFKKAHYETLKEALDKSKSTMYPVLGYVDSSRAKDVVHMVKALAGLDYGSEQIFVTDAYYLENVAARDPKIKHTWKWGDRTCTFICDRNDPIYRDYSKYTRCKIGNNIIPDPKDPDKIGHRIAFFYIKLNNSQLARVEFPEWCLMKNKTNRNIVEEIANIIRAESVLGSGYPYIIDQCHHRTVIRGEDRLKFLRFFQKFGAVNNVKVRIRNKARSKMGHSNRFF